jgi:CBS domain-containing protein
MECSQIMRNPIAIEPHASVGDAARTMRDEITGFLPVWDAERRPIGVITDRDIAVRACAAKLDVEQARVSDIMSRDLVSCRTTDDLRHAEELMTRYQKWRIVVVNDDGTLAGVISVTDLSHGEPPLSVGPIVRQVCARELRVKSR